MTVEQGRIRILMAKAGLDGHDRGVKVVARALRDAGMEVVYTGLHQTPEQVVRAGVDEDVDAIGLSLLSGAHMTLFPRILELLRQEDAQDIMLFGGGTIPEDDVRTLKQMGVAELFTPGASTIDIVEWIRNNVSCRAPAAS
ncbi:MAG: cobalamin B12-binding domain-containing protein [Chloroflexota bacterium]